MNMLEIIHFELYPHHEGFEKISIGHVFLACIPEVDVGNLCLQFVFEYYAGGHVVAYMVVCAAPY